jgi:hypothetical protein
MASPAALLSILVTANTAQATAALTGVQAEMTATEKRSHALGKAAGTLGLVMAGGLALGIRAGFKEMQDSAKVSAQTEAVLKSTGGTANVTAGHIDKLASSLLKKSGIDDEVIKSGENMLLTFTNIRNEAGKGNDVFDQATKTLVDMAVALGKDPKTAAIQLGKALQDPIKGISALHRVGVQFTDGQKAQIKAMVDAGDRMGAQKVILKELNKEFGGSAEAAGKTLPGQLSRLSETFKNLAASVTEAMIPSLLAVVGPLQTVAQYLADHQKVAQALVVVLGTVAAILVSVSVGTKLYAAGQAIATAATAAWTAAQWLLNAALAANPIALVVIALAALAAGLYLAYQKIGPFHDAVDALGDGLKDVFGWVKDHWPLLLAILTGPVGLAVLEIAKHGGDIVDFFKKLPGRIVAAIQSAASSVVAVGGWIINRILDGIKGVAGFAADVGGWVKNRVSDGVHAVADAVIAVGSWITNRIADGITTLTDSLASVGGWIKNRVVELVHNTADGFIAVGGWALNRFVDGFTTVTDALAAVGGWVKNRIVELVHNSEKDFGSLGGWVVGRFVDGITASVDAVKDAAKWLRDKIVDAVKDFFGINSPSKVMMDLGGHIATGLIKGVVGKDIPGFIKGHLGSMGDLAGKLVKKGLLSVEHLPGKALDALGGILGIGGGGGGGASGSNQEIGKKMMLGMGWDSNQWPALKALWIGESGWNEKALNASSGAYGIPQALPAGKMASAGADWRTNAATQIKWGLGYIKSVYGSPANAYAQWLARSPHWYASGTNSAARGWAVVGERGPEIVNFGGGEQVIPNHALGGQTVVVEHHYHGPVVQDKQFLDYLRNLDRNYGRQNARPAFGG